MEYIKRTAILVLALSFSLISKPLFAQDVYLRLTDYGGGKTNIVIEPFFVSRLSDELITKVRNIEHIVKNDLEYSLYFEIYSDTIFLIQSDSQGIVLKGSVDNERLSIVLEDFLSRETIARRDYKLSTDIRKLSHTISDDVVEILTGEKGIASTKIVFSYKTATGKELAMIDYDGFTFTPLTKNENFNLFPAWAPDGKRVLFSTYLRGRLNLYVFDLERRVIESLSSFQGLNFAPCWSPDGTKICLSLTKDGNAEIYLLDLETKKLNRLTNNRAIDVSPAFSPNSREIAFVSDRSGNPQIYVMDIYGGNVRRLTYHGSYNTSPAWSPRGDIIAYVSREDDNSQQIYITDPYDFSPIRLTYDGNNEEPSWSPDGLHIVFASNRHGRYELCTMNWDGSRQRRLTNSITANGPDWSPVPRLSIN
ncbi:MAG: PD40 domain-containing protein [candidate division WOR-3 bacterium]|nr:MAG: PD40 domain-containing protein [candidate division WOR-3 bacterium]